MTSLTPSAADAVAVPRPIPRLAPRSLPPFRNSKIHGRSLRAPSRISGEKAWLLADRAGLPLAGEELLHYLTPVKGLARTATRSYPLGDRESESGKRLRISWAAANLDAHAFDHSDDVRLDRWPNRHAAFGLGAHRCLGSNVARAVWPRC